MSVVVVAVVGVVGWASEDTPLERRTSWHPVGHGGNFWDLGSAAWTLRRTSQKYRHTHKRQHLYLPPHKTAASWSRFAAAL